MSEWIRLMGDKFEERPYRECPNCGKYKFRKEMGYYRISGHLWWSKHKWLLLETCKNCKYDTNLKEFDNQPEL